MDMLHFIQVKQICSCLFANYGVFKEIIVSQEQMNWRLLIEKVVQEK